MTARRKPRPPGTDPSPGRAAWGRTDRPHVDRARASHPPVGEPSEDAPGPTERTGRPTPGTAAEGAAEGPRGERSPRDGQPVARKETAGRPKRPGTAHAGPDRSARGGAKRSRGTTRRDRPTARPAPHPAPAPPSAPPAPPAPAAERRRGPFLLTGAATTVIGVPTEATPPRRAPKAATFATAPTRTRPRTSRPTREPRASAALPTAPVAALPAGTATEPPTRSGRAGGAGRKGGRGRTAEEAFDRLYAGSAAALLRQVELLTGDGEFARRAVAHAFDVTWQRWPEVARDTDPVGWVRAAGHDFALAPWQRWMPAHRRPRPRTPEEPLAAALLELSAPQRRAVLLHDGLGLDVLAAATEVEATMPAAAARVAHAREELAATVPGLGADALPVRLGALLNADGEPPEHPREVRDASERCARRRTVAAFALTVLIAVATTVAVVAGPGHRAAAPRGAVPTGPAHTAGADPFPSGVRPRADTAR